jgi:hypothetical protein
MDDEACKGLVGCLILAIGVPALLVASYVQNKTVSLDEKLDPGYASAAKVKVETRDLRNDNHHQTVLQYDGKSYLLKVDSDGQLYAVPYRIEPKHETPAKVVPLITPEKEPEVNAHG